MITTSYPIYLKLQGRLVVVAGAGRVATRKIERLVTTGAALRVVALRASPSVQRLAQEGKLTLHLRDVRPDDAAGAWLVLCATDDTSANAALAAAARAQRAWVLRADAPEESDFTVPARARGDHVDATISTGGAAPSASRRLGCELRAWIARGPDRFAKEVALARAQLRDHPEAAERLRRLGGSDLFDACSRGDEPRIAALLQEALEAGP